jgi:hypothetical protein
MYSTVGTIQQMVHRSLVTQPSRVYQRDQPEVIDSRAAESGISALVREAPANTEHVLRTGQNNLLLLARHDVYNIHTLCFQFATRLIPACTERLLQHPPRGAGWFTEWLTSAKALWMRITCMSQVSSQGRGKGHTEACAGPKRHVCDCPGMGNKQ